MLLYVCFEKTAATRDLRRNTFVDDLRMWLLNDFFHLLSFLVFDQRHFQMMIPFHQRISQFEFNGKYDCL